uniref:NACHT and WD repeat domain-containing protein 1 n=1 Tax=Magallana gigas TaxID=29159 RepID=K1PUT9_MAGGI
MYRKYLQEIAIREKQMGNNCSGTLTRHPNPQSSENRRTPPEPPTPLGHHATESGNQNAQNPGPSNSTGTQNPAQAPPKVLTEEQKKFKEKQKRELEALVETVDETEKMIFMAFPFQEAIILGNFYATFPNTMKTIRIFTSSTFTDTKYERNCWMEKAYPKIKEHCFKKGYEFQVVDMRWGIRNQATDDHMTTELCLHELRECQKLSKGPSFISLFAHKYGYRSLSREINGEEFRKIQGAVTNQADLEHLLRWYELDSNAVPGVFLLNPISRNIPDFLSKDFETQKKAKSEWWTESERLMEIIATGATEGLDRDSARKYKISECLGDEKVWQKARAMNKDLKDRMTSKLNADHVHTYELNWMEKGIDPDCREHADYLEKITTDFQNQMIASIDESIKERENDKKLTLKPDHEEFMEHAVLVRKKCDGVRGRDHIVKKIKDYVLGDSMEPLIVHGESGCGKTSIVALAAREAFSWIHGNGMVIMRFLGSTQDSSNVMSLLQSMNSQIEKYFKLRAVKSQDIKELIKTFKTYLRFFVLKKKTIVIFIDSIDQLDKSHNGRLVSSWIPNNLLKSAKIIISTIDHPDFGVFPDIKVRPFELK